MVGATDIVLHGAEPCVVVAQAEVDADDPFEAVAAGRGEQQPGGEERVGDELFAQLPQGMSVADVVEVEAEQTAVLDKPIVVAVAEGAREAHEVEVRSLELAGLFGIVDGAKLAGDGHGRDVECDVFVNPRDVSHLIGHDVECGRSEE